MNNCEITNEQIGDALRKIRREKNLTQKQVAKDMNISQGYLSEMEKGKRPIRLDFTIKLLNYYNENMDRIFQTSGTDLADISDTAEVSQKSSNEELLYKFLECTGVENSADVYLDLCRYMMIRWLYRLNPFNSDKIFSIPKKLAVSLALSEIEKCCENLYDYLAKSPEKCKNLEFKEEYNKYLSDLINRCEKMLK